MPGIIEDMPFEARMERIKEIAVALAELVRRFANITVADALKKAAEQLRVAISQVKYGLNYALSRNMFRLSDDETLIPA